LGALGIIFFKNLLAYQFMMGFYGFGIGIAEAVTVSNACAFLPHKKGLINGLANVFWTLSCSLFNFLGQVIVNPDGLPHDDKTKMYSKEISENIITYSIFAIICLAILTTITVILSFPYKKEKYETLSEEEESKEKENNEEKEERKSDEIVYEEENKKKESKKDDDITFVSYLKKWRFYTCFILITFRNTNYFLLTSSFTVIANHYDIVNEEKQKWISTVSFILNFGLLFLVSLFVDKIKYRTIIIPSNIACFIHALTIPFIIPNEVLYIIYFFIVGIFASIDNAATFPHIMKIFGLKYIVQIWGIFAMGAGLASFGFSQLASYLLSYYSEQNELETAIRIIFYLDAGLTLVALIMMFFENEKPLFGK
jgi:hypothetical protein